MQSQQHIEIEKLESKIQSVKKLIDKLVEMQHLIQDKVQNNLSTPILQKGTYQSIFSSPDKEQQLIMSLEQPSLVPQFRSLLVSPTQKQIQRTSNLEKHNSNALSSQRKFFLPQGKHFKKRSGSSSNIQVKKSDYSVQTSGILHQRKQNEIDLRDSDKLTSPQTHLQKGYNRLHGQVSQFDQSKTKIRKAENSDSRVLSEKSRFQLQSEPRKHQLFLRNLQKYMNFENKDESLLVNKSPSRLFESNLVNPQFTQNQRDQKSPLVRRQNKASDQLYLGGRRSRERSEFNTSRIEKLNSTKQIQEESQIIQEDQQNVQNQNYLKTDLSRSIIERPKDEEVKKNLIRKAYLKDERQKVYTTFQKRDMSFEVSVSARGKAESHYIEQTKYLNTNEGSIEEKDEDNYQMQGGKRVGTQYSTEFQALKYQSKIAQIQQASRTKKTTQLHQSLNDQKIFDSPIKDELESDYATTNRLEDSRGNSNITNTQNNYQIDIQILKKMEIYDSLYNPPKLTEQLLDILLTHSQIDSKLHELFFQYKRQIIEKLRKMLNMKSKNVLKIVMLIEKLEALTVGTELRKQRLIDEACY
eukprot:403344442